MSFRTGKRRGIFSGCNKNVVILSTQLISIDRRVLSRCWPTPNAPGCERIAVMFQVYVEQGAVFHGSIYIRL